MALLVVSRPGRRGLWRRPQRLGSDDSDSRASRRGGGRQRRGGGLPARRRLRPATRPRASPTTPSRSARASRSPGTYAAFAEISTGYQAYFDYVNEELGGVDGHQIELVTLDDGYEPGRTATNAQRLVQEEGVFALFNVIGTSNNTAIWDDLDDECVPNLFAGTGSPLWGDPAHAWTIGSFPSYSLEAVMYANYLEENEPDANVALLTQNDDFGESYVDTFKAAIEGTDITVVAEETYDFTNPDTTSQITSLAASGRRRRRPRHHRPGLPERAQRHQRQQLGPDDLHLRHLHLADPGGPGRARARPTASSASPPSRTPGTRSGTTTRRWQLYLEKGREYGGPTSTSTTRSWPTAGRWAPCWSTR